MFGGCERSIKCFETLRVNATVTIFVFVLYCIVMYSNEHLKVMRENNAEAP